MKSYIAKPFLKWAGGKSQLLSALDAHLPSFFSDNQEITYIEPFVGGGAMLFFLLQKYPAISTAVINDLNSHLISAYSVIRNKPYGLIEHLEAIDRTYKSMKDYEEQKEFYIKIRTAFNTHNLTDLEEVSYLIFLNRTCFNGLYRENSKGCYNVPFGRYSNPTICDKDLILADSRLLQKVTILQGDFSQTAKYLGQRTFVYLDPPYRPLNATSNFNSYVKEAFDDNEQIRLKHFVDALSEAGCYIMESNSDGRSKNPENLFFDDLYKDYIIERVTAKRYINANPQKRGDMSELLIRNYA